ncbi:alpha/beta hydrolase family protein [Planctomycetaceae bacterium SH139]
MNSRMCFLLVSFLVGLSANLSAQSSIAVLPQVSDADPAGLMQTWLMQRAAQAFGRWESRYESLKTPAQIAAYQTQMRQQFVDALGGFPERTPLNARVTGTVQRDGYRVEKVLFESEPHNFVSGLCFVPDAERFQAPYPGVLVVCGHSANGKGYDGYQTATAMLAKHGIVGFIIDPICQGERLQHFNPDGSVRVASSTQGHTLLGLGAILLGKNTATTEIWDGMRAIDYLQQRPDVDGELIGCMGNSGGGTQTAYLMALDDRIKAASPACYITTFEALLNTIGPQDAEQNIFAQLDWGMEHSDYLLMRAPTPILMCTATQDFFSIEGAWTSFRRGKRLFGRLGHPERIGLVEVDEPHGWHRPLREAAVQWMVRWLAGRDELIREPKLELLSAAELQVTPTGQVLQIEGAKSIGTLQLEEFQQLNQARKQLWATPKIALARVRELSNIRPLDDIPAPTVRKLETIERDGIAIQPLVLTGDAGVPLPALLYQPTVTTPLKGQLIYLHEAGKQASIEQQDTPLSALHYAKLGYQVLALDVRGIGETAPRDAVWYHPRFGADGKHLAIAYLLGENYIGMRAEDLLIAARWLQTQASVEANDRANVTPLALVAIGKLGPVALHAAALQPSMFAKVTIFNSINTWETIFSSLTSQDQFVNCIHGAARVYDLQDLINQLGDQIEMINVVDAMGNSVE